MKKILLLGFFLPLLWACSSDDSQSNSSPTLEVTVDPITSLNATVRWTYSGQGNTVYRIFLNDEIIEENFSGTEYTFEIQNETDYQGTIFAISQSDEETFQNFSFSTVGSDIWYGPYQYSPAASTADLPYRIITGELRLVGDINTIIPKISNLEEVGSLTLRGVDGLTNLEPFSELKYHYGEGWVVINECDDLNSISGLENMNGNVTGLSLYRCPQLSDLSGMEFSNTASLIFNEIPITDFTDLNTPTSLEFLKISSCFELESLNGLENVQQLEGSLDFYNLPILENIDPLGDMTIFNGYINLINLPSLTQINGLSQVQSISTQFRVKYTGIASIDPLLNCASFNSYENNFFIHIQGNNNLENLDGLGNIVFNTNGGNGGNCRIRIEGNYELNDFCGMRDFLLSIPEEFELPGNIGGNAFNPSIQDIIDGNCSL